MVLACPFESDLASAHTGEGTISGEQGLYIDIDDTNIVTNPLFKKIYCGNRLVSIVYPHALKKAY